MKSIVFFFFIISVSSSAQDTIAVYSRPGIDRGINLVKTRTGYIATGFTNNPGSKEDGLILFYNDQMQLVKEKQIGGKELDFLWGVAETKDKGYIITGFTNSFGNGGSDAWMIRLNEKGDTVWSKTFGGAKDERAVSITQVSDGNYIITGETYSYGNGDRDILLLKINDRGDILWNKTFGAEKSDRGFYTYENSKGNLVICGITENNSNNDIDAFIKCCDKNGNELWHKTYGGKGMDVFHSMLLDDQDNIIVAGYKEYQPKLHHPWIAKMNAEGKVISDQLLDMAADARVMDIFLTKDNQLIGTGYTKQTAEGDWDILLLKGSIGGSFTYTTYHFEKEDQAYALLPYQNNSALIIGHSYGIRNKDGDLIIVKWSY